ncbi:MAG TPA: TonB-dependent receptor, partial [Novosphingobium sp.]|nr:TonB-dependent receptor [Novosphingobium sp.]
MDRTFSKAGQQGRKWLLCGTALVAMATLGSAARAQEASNSAKSDSAVAEIVVTAQKRAENVQDVPKVVEVVSTAKLAEAGVTNLQDLSRVSVAIQGISATPFGPPAIRGISSFALSIGVQTQTGIVLDDIPLPSFSTLANELTDIERVEVLPGPQSTLSGRNAAGGLINIVTHNPTDHLTANLNLEQTNDRQTKVGGYISGPITGNLGYSVSGFYDKWDGLIRNAGENGLLLNGFEQRGVRAKLKWQPAPRLSLLLTGYYTKGDFLNAALIGGAPYIRADAGAGSIFSSGSTFAQLYPGVTPGAYNTTTSSAQHGTSANENYGFSLRADLDTGIGTASSISSYAHGNQPRKDLFLAYPFAGTTVWAHTDTDVRYISQELRLASAKRESRLQYLGGVIYTDTRNFEPYSREPVFPVNWDRTSQAQSLAVYGRATYAVLPHTKLTGGLRYQHDHQSYDWVFVDGTAPRSQGRSNYDFVAGEVSLQQDLARDVKAYVTYANAQTGKAYDLEDNGSAATSAGLQPLASEKVQNVELGLKSQWFGRRLTVNISAFRAAYHNYQVQATLPTTDPNVVPVIRLYAVGAVRNQGVELSTSFRASKALNLGLDASYLDAQIRDYPGAQCFTGQTEAQGCVGGVQNRRG